MTNHNPQLPPNLACVIYEYDGKRCRSKAVKSAGPTITVEVEFTRQRPFGWLHYVVNPGSGAVTKKQRIVLDSYVKLVKRHRRKHSVREVAA